MIGVKVDKNNNSKNSIQKKSASDTKSKSAPAVTQLCGCGGKDKKEQDGATAFAPRDSFWSPELVKGKFSSDVKQLKSAPSNQSIQINKAKNGIAHTKNSSSNNEQA